MKNKKLLWQLPFLLFLIVGTWYVLRSQPPFRSSEGLIFGTVYKVTYRSAEDLQADIRLALQQVDRSLSTFDTLSVISQINQNVAMRTDSMFEYVFDLAQKVSADTHGAFDITVAPLVNAWGFGFRSAPHVDSAYIARLMPFVGYHKVRRVGHEVHKSAPEVMLDCSAIAKGYGVDVVAGLMDRKGIDHYMIDIGGEVVVKGKNAHMEPWRIGINKPVSDSLSLNNDLQTVLAITDRAIATSGNYRNFYVKEGKKFAHTIDPRTGYPVLHSLLSATVVAPTCALADAYATAFMVMGVDSAMAICNRHKELEGYFIYADERGDNQVVYTSGMKRYLTGRGK